MKSLLILAALTAGQSDVARYAVQHEGMSIEVEGRWNPERGTITWNPDLEFNRRAVAAAHEARPRPSIQNFGLSPERMGLGKRAAASPEATRFIAESHSDVGHAEKVHVTVIGAGGTRDAVVNDIRTHPAFADLKDHLYVQSYRPEEWAVDPALGFAPGGSPTIIVQQAKGPSDPKGGRVLYRATDYSMGPDGLALALAEAVRKADPSYNPARDPGPANGWTADLGLNSDHAAYAMTALVALLVVLTLPRKGR